MTTNWIASFWRGEAALARVFWEYAIAWGTLLNLLGTGAALVVFIKGGPDWLGLLLHFAAVPYNVLMVVSIWRAAAREDGTALANFARPVSLIWFVVMLVI
jgi:hypothetical protein